jgi:hypothetical protein
MTPNEQGQIEELAESIRVNQGFDKFKWMGLARWLIEDLGYSLHPHREGKQPDYDGLVHDIHGGKAQPTSQCRHEFIGKPSMCSKCGEYEPTPKWNSYVIKCLNCGTYSGITDKPYTYWRCACGWEYPKNIPTPQTFNP